MCSKIIWVALFFSTSLVDTWSVVPVAPPVVPGPQATSVAASVVASVVRQLVKPRKTFPSRSHAHLIASALLHTIRQQTNFCFCV